MKPGDKCQLLKIYVSEDSKYKGHNLYTAIVYRLKKFGIAGATVTRAIEGYGKLRHSCASMLIIMGFTLKDVLEWLGHVGIKETENIYSHLDVKRKKDIAEKLSGAMGQC